MFGALCADFIAIELKDLEVGQPTYGIMEFFLLLLIDKVNELH